MRCDTLRTLGWFPSLLTEAEAPLESSFQCHHSAHTHQMNYLPGSDGLNQEDVPVFLPGLIVERPAAYKRGLTVLRREKACVGVFVGVCGGGYRGFAESWRRSLSVLATITKFHLPDIPTHSYKQGQGQGMPRHALLPAQDDLLRLVRKTVQMYGFVYSGSSRTVCGV